MPQDLSARRGFLHKYMNNDKWFFIEEGKEIEIPLEAWVWHVVFKDGTDLWQFDRVPGTDGKRWFHQFREIDQQNVAIFEMVNAENPELRFSIDVDEGMQIFHFYRRSRLEIGTPQETHVTFYVFGYKADGVGRYHFILPNNRLVITSNKDIKLL
jgi:hypothetical protein